MNHNELRGQCPGCGCRMAGITPGAMVSGTPTGTRYVCQSCTRRAMACHRFKATLDHAMIVGIPATEFERVMASIGVFELPTTAEEMRTALGLLEGRS